MSSEPVVRDVPERSRYEILVDGEVAGFLIYRGGGSVRVFEHTQVGDGFEGRGIGGRLVRGALDDVRARGGHIVPRCPFVRRWLAEHPDHREAVAPAFRSALAPPAA